MRHHFDPRSQAMRDLERRLRRLEDDLDSIFVALAAAQMTPRAARRVAEARLAQFRRELAVWVRRGVTEAMRDGMAIVAGPGLSPASGVTRRALREIEADTFGDIARATTFVREDVKRLVREAVKLRTTIHVKEPLTHPTTIRALRDDLRKIGLRFVDRSGRHWRLRTYAQMVARTKSAQAYNAGTVLHGAAAGVRHYEVFDGTGDRGCAVANGSIVTAEWAMANPIEHPNCVRGFGPVAG